MVKTPTKTVWLRLSAKELARLERIAKAHNRSRASLLGIIVRDGIARKGVKPFEEPA